MKQPSQGQRPTRRIEFLERSSYRQRRFRDAARMVPVFAAVLMVLPLMWPRAEADQSLTSSGMIYLFTLWVVLVCLAFGLSRVLRYAPDSDGEDVSQGRET